MPCTLFYLKEDKPISIIYKFDGQNIILDRKKLLESGRDALSREELEIFNILLHKIKCYQERVRRFGNGEEESE